VISKAGDQPAFVSQYQSKWRVSMSVQLLLKGKGNYVPIIRSALALKDVIDQLDVDNAGALVVTDDGQSILGIITERDIARGLKTFGRDVLDRALREIMTKDVITCDVNQPLTTVLQLMDQHQIHYVPITKDGQLCGIINMLDLVKYRLAETETETNELKAYVTGSR
jgi:CBS domain-containing protein